MQKAPSLPPKEVPVAKQKHLRKQQRSRNMKALPMKTLVMRTCQMSKHQRRKTRKETTRPRGKRQRLRQKRKDSAETRTFFLVKGFMNGFQRFYNQSVIHLRPMPLGIYVYIFYTPKTELLSGLLAINYILSIAFRRPTSPNSEPLLAPCPT